MEIRPAKKSINTNQNKRRFQSPPIILKNCNTFSFSNNIVNK